MKENVSFGSFFKKQTSTQTRILLLVWFVDSHLRNPRKIWRLLQLLIPR
jgi:hypothetical protein